MTIITKERLENLFNNLVEELDLNYGNGGFDCLENYKRFIGYIEAPNNTTLMIDIEFGLNEEMTDEEIRNVFLEGMKESIDNFDPEETFEEIWHRDFEYSAFEFVDMLREDEEFFKEKYSEHKKKDR
jgi:hypothetical protein